MICFDKEIGDIDFDYLLLDFDIVEKVSKSLCEGCFNWSFKWEY